MHRLTTLGPLLLMISGCASSVPYGGPIPPPAGQFYASSVLLSHGDHQVVWSVVVDVVDDHFKIKWERPVRLVGNVLTDGRLETFPLVGSTILEPWHGDSANPYEKLQSTLQSIRRRAEVTVSHAEGGFRVDVAVYKELEDALQPAHATAGAATFRYDGTLTRVVNPVGQQDINDGWLPLGRDAALESRIIGQLSARMATTPVVVPAPPLQW